MADEQSRPPDDKKSPIPGDESLEDSANLAHPRFIAEEIAEDLEAALDQFENDYQRSKTIALRMCTLRNPLKTP